jgi:Fe-S-cluster-containing hydrogenase component 2
MNACPVNAITIDERTGAKVVIDRLCIGCHLCTIACPFGTVFTHPQSHQATKCNLCGGEPACAAACPTAAIEFLDQPQPGAWFEPWSERVTKNFEAAAAAGGA